MTNEYFSLILSKINSNFLFPYRRCYSLPLKIKINLITSRIFPILDYCCLVFSSFSGYLLNKLTIALNKTIRFIFKLRRYNSITPFRKKLKWFDIASRHKYFLGTLTFKILKTKKKNKNKNKYLDNEFEEIFLH